MGLKSLTVTLGPDKCQSSLNPVSRNWNGRKHLDHSLKLGNFSTFGTAEVLRFHEMIYLLINKNVNFVNKWFIIGN